MSRANILLFRIHAARSTCVLACSVIFNSLWHQAPLSLGLSWQGYGVGCHFLLQRIFPTRDSNPYSWCLLRWQVDSLPCTTWPWSTCKSQIHLTHSFGTSLSFGYFSVLKGWLLWVYRGIDPTGLEEWNCLAITWEYSPVPGFKLTFQSQ